MMISFGITMINRADRQNNNSRRNIIAMLWLFSVLAVIGVYLAYYSSNWWILFELIIVSEIASFVKALNKISDKSIEILDKGTKILDRVSSQKEMALRIKNDK